MNAESPIESAASADCELELISAAMMAIGEVNIMADIKVPTVNGKMKTPNTAAARNIGSPQKVSSPSQAVITMPMPIKNPTIVPKIVSSQIN